MLDKVKIMLDKVNIIRIVRDHIYTLRDYGTGKYKVSDFFLFFGVPLFIAISCAYFKISLTQNLISLLVTSMSIFAALLFNLLLLIYDILQKSNNENVLKITLLKEIYSNISFCILIAVLMIILLILIDILGNRIYLFIYMTYYLITLFLLTLLMILKRIHILLYKEIQK